MTNVVISYVYKTEFELFAKKVIKILAPDVDLQQCPYIIWMLLHLALLSKREIRRLMISLPPRHLKTICTVAFILWEIVQRPKQEIMIVSYNEAVAELILEKVREVMGSDWFEDNFEVSIGRTNSRSRIIFEQGGSISALSASGGVTGRGADIIVVDDAHNISDAFSPALIKRAVDNIMTSVFTRLNSARKGRILIIGHRISEDDLIGTLIEEEAGFEHLSLSYQADEDEVFTLGTFTWARKAGECLRPDNASEVERLRKQRSVPTFETLHQQNPGSSPLALHSNSFPVFQVAPNASGGTLLTVDWAFSIKEKRSFSVAQAWRTRNGSFYLLDQWRARAGITELISGVKEMVRRHQCNVVVIESGSLFVVLEKELRRYGNVCRVEESCTGNRSKLERFSEVLEIIENQLVTIPISAPWKSEFIEEICAFPNAETDDQVDAMTQALLWFKKNNLPPLPPRCWGAIVTGPRRPLGRGPFVFFPR